jgi:hypothetical protein
MTVLLSMESLTGPQKKLNSSPLYEDKYGNQVLVVTEGDNDSVLVNGHKSP